MNVDRNEADEDEGVRASFAKAEGREPAWGVASGFVPPGSRRVFRAWIALLGELRECAFELSDPRVTAAKSAWWAEEFEGLARGAARHPISRALARHRLPWSRLSGPLLTTAQDLDPGADLDGALSALAPLATVVVGLELALFEADAVTADAASRALAVHWLRHRLEQGLDAPDRARVPLALFARHGVRRDQLPHAEGAALRLDWAGQLLGALPEAGRGWPYPRHFTVEIDRTALRALSASRPSLALGGFRAVWKAWRSARNAALQVCPPGVPTT